jgi:hypothetical protein
MVIAQNSVPGSHIPFQVPSNISNNTPSGGTQNYAIPARAMPTGSNNISPIFLISILVIFSIFIFLGVWYFKLPLSEQKPTGRRFSFQGPLGTLVCALFLGADTLWFLLFFVFAKEIAGADLAGIGVLFIAGIITLVLIPIYAMALKSLRKFIKSANWDYFVLYPFTILNLFFLGRLVMTWHLWF